MIDFGFSELAASDLLLANDVAELRRLVERGRRCPNVPPRTPPQSVDPATRRSRPSATAAVGLERRDPQRRSSSSPASSTTCRKRLASAREVVNLGWLVLAGVGLAILRPPSPPPATPTIPTWEQRVFHAVNGLPDWLLPDPLAADAARQPRRRHRRRARPSRRPRGDVSVAVGVVLADGAEARRRAASCASRCPTVPRRPPATGDEPDRCRPPGRRAAGRTRASRPAT